MSSASNNMDKKLLLIQHLYGEREDAEELKELLKDPACRAEYEALRDVKRKLENRALRRPVTAPESAVDQIIASARPKLTLSGNSPPVAQNDLQCLVVWGQ